MILLQSYYYLLYFKREFCFYHGNVECCGLYFVCFVVLVFCFWVNKINLSVQSYDLTASIPSNPSPPHSGDELLLAASSRL